MLTGAVKGFGENSFPYGVSITKKIDSDHSCRFVMITLSKMWLTTGNRTYVLQKKYDRC